MELIILGICIFLIAVAVIELGLFGLRRTRTTQRLKIRKRLKRHVYVESGVAGTEILKKRIYSDVPAINSLLTAIPGLSRLDDLVAQADAKYPIGFYILFSLLLMVIGFLFGNIFVRNPFLSYFLLLVGALLPFAYLNSLKRKRIEKFRKQFPEALDLIARALKAGHAFSGAMGLAAEEFDAPLGPEFSETLDEINFGLSVSDALVNLSKRVDCEEIKYFVVGVILQRETGGNLAELIETLATLLREKFKFQGKVRVLSAEAKMSAIILSALPFFVGGYIWFTTPDFLSPLLNESFGRMLLLGAGCLMIFGMLVMRKMVKIEV